jgi:hypothetical protein
MTAHTTEMRACAKERPCARCQATRGPTEVADETFGEMMKRFAAIQASLAEIHRMLEIALFLSILLAVLAVP